MVVVARVGVSAFAFGVHISAVGDSVGGDGDVSGVHTVAFGDSVDGGGDGGVGGGGVEAALRRFLRAVRSSVWLACGDG